MLMLTETFKSGTATNSRPTASMFRFQLLIGVIAACVMPMIALWLSNKSLPLDSAQSLHSILAALLGAVGGVVLYRRLGMFPGLRNIENVVPSFVISFAVAAVALLLLRLEYSRIHLVIGFVFTVGFFVLIAIRLQRRSLYHFWVVPSGETSDMPNLANCRWHRLAHAMLPDEPIDGIVADFRADIGDDWERTLAEAVLQGHSVYHVKQLRESLTGRVRLEHMSENSFGSLIPNLSYRKTKRVFDFCAALAALPLLLPVFAVVAVLIKLDSKGPVFFRQVRAGYRGRPFRCIKFRSMYHGSGAAEASHGRAAAMTRDDDDRVTPIGRYLRRYRIDELPQVFNILMGEMSWIGPRPEAAALSSWYGSELAYYSYRHIVRPGITGWAQVNQGHVVELDEIDEKLQYDFYYIKYFSFWLDILIALRTVRIITGGFGSK